jgi:putative transposase
MLNFTCFHGQPFFRSDRTCRWMLDALTQARSKHAFKLWSYCIMPDHFHFLIYPAPGTEVGPILVSIKQSVANRAVAWVKRNAPAFLPRMAEHRAGGRTIYHFWQPGGGYDRNLWTPKKIWDAIDYIHMNPVAAGLCARPEDWPWSSAWAYIPEHPPPPVAIDLDLGTLPPDPRTL